MKKLLALLLALTMILALGSSAYAAVPKFMTVGTGSTGGAYYPIGVAIAEVLTSKLGTQATAEVTGGSLDNLRLINDGDCDLCDSDCEENEDGDYNERVMWCDGGVGNFYIKPENLKALDFSDVLYNWDCG